MATGRMLGIAARTMGYGVRVPIRTRRPGTAVADHVESGGYDDLEAALPGWPASAR
ncbi:MAG: hypothetical protein R3C32_12920 [Chloroflexota bacterium]